MSTIHRLSILLAGIAVITACDPTGPNGVKDPDNVNHGDCQIIWQNTNWTFGELLLKHNDPRSCPDSVDPHEIVSAGGRVIETAAWYPNLSLDSDVLILTILNTNTICQSFGNELAKAQQIFWWYDYDCDGDQDWTVGLWLDYEAGTWDQNRDCAVFQVDLRNTPTPEYAIAHVKIDYTENDQ